MRTVVIALGALLMQSYPPPVAREGARHLLGNERVIVWELQWPKGKPTPVHRHDLEHVSIGIEQGPVLVRNLDGSSFVGEGQKLGGVIYGQKGTTHSEEGQSDRSRRAVWVQLKEGVKVEARQGTVQGDAFPPSGTTKTFENDRVIVWDYRLSTEVVQHRHTADYVGVSLAEGRVRRDELSPGVLDRVLELTVLDRALHEGALDRFDAATPTASLVNRSPFSAEPAESVDLDFSGPVPGFGWQMPETHPITGAGFRWIGPLPEASLFLPLRRDRDLDLRLTIQKAITPEVLAGLRLRVDGHDVDLRAEGTGDDEPPLTLVGRLPTSTEATAGRFRLSVESTTSPAALGRAPDRRQLGVAFSRLELRPAP